MKKFAIYPSPIGYIRVEHLLNRVTQLRIDVDRPSEWGTSDLFTDSIYSQILEYINGERTTFDVEIDIDCATPFQGAVFEELCKIPYGQTRSYKQIATALNRPKSARAVGMANNRNPIHIIIPCHRVIGSDGSLVGYAAGVDIKRYLLKLESDKNIV